MSTQVMNTIEQSRVLKSPTTEKARKLNVFASLVSKRKKNQNTLALLMQGAGFFDKRKRVQGIMLKNAANPRVLSPTKGRRGQRYAFSLCIINFELVHLKLTILCVKQ